MPRKCSVCSHPEREAIDQHLVNGEAMNKLAALYRVSSDALNRHNASHLPATLIKSQGIAEITRADLLVSELSQLQVRTLEILAQAEDSGELRTALVAIAQARSNLELMAKLQGQLESQAPTVNLLIAPDWLKLRTEILAALDEHPVAKLAVVKALAGGNHVGR